MRRLLTFGIYALAILIGLAAFIYPFFISATALPANMGASRTVESPLLTLLLLVLCLLVLLLEIQGQAVNAKIIAALGVLIATASILRFIETAVPGPGGFSPIFAPIILAGYVFGPRFGFLMGSLTVLVSGLVTGGIGPWLPYQMFAAGWVGLTSGWLPHPREQRVELAMLISFGFLWGLLYGVITNLFFWPFMLGDPAASWQTGLGLQEGMRRYVVFYIVSSFVWDLARAFGNAILIWALGLPTVRALRRFKDRFQFEVQPA